MKTDLQLIEDLKSAHANISKDRPAFCAAFNACTPIQNDAFVDSYFDLEAVLISETGTGIDEVGAWEAGLRGGETVAEVQAIAGILIKANADAQNIKNEADQEHDEWLETANSMNKSFAYNH